MQRIFVFVVVGKFRNCYCSVVGGSSKWEGMEKFMGIFVLGILECE